MIAAQSGASSNGPTPARGPSSPLALQLSRLLKPGLTGLVVFTTGAGYLLGDLLYERSTLFELSGLLALVTSAVGTTLTAAGASVFNQIIERGQDRLMNRTRLRPLATGEFSTARGLQLGLGLSVLGLAIIWLGSNALAAALAAASLLIYALIYTPLKRRLTLNTLVGAVPGALPPLIGWAAARNALEPGGWFLFTLLFVWQIPHFLAIAWMYREDYARGGFQMLPVVDETGQHTSRMALLYALALLPISWAAPLLRLTGWVYWIGATALGLYFIATAFALHREPSFRAARRLFLASVIYLPSVLVLMILDGTQF
ncbi:MAG: heme o synthase [Planctomycetota bacterium]